MKIKAIDSFGNVANIEIIESANGYTVTDDGEKIAGAKTIEAAQKKAAAYCRRYGYRGFLLNNK